MVGQRVYVLSLFLSWSAVAAPVCAVDPVRAQVEALYPIPDFTPEQCQAGDRTLFEKAAAALLEPDRLDKGDERTQAIVRNLLQEHAFTRLVEIAADQNTRWFPYMAFELAIANEYVGTILRQSYRGSPGHPFAETEAFSKLAGSWVMSSTMKEFGELNQEVGALMLWPHLMAVRCGPAAVVDLLERETPAAGKAEEHAALIAAWRGLEESDVTGDRALSVRASQQLMHVEQRFVLQERVYGTFLNRIVYGTRLLNSLAQSPSPAKPLSLDEFARANGTSNNVSDLEGRLRWLDYEIALDADYIDERLARGEAATFLRGRRERVACYLRGVLPSPPRTE